MAARADAGAERDVPRALRAHGAQGAANWPFRILRTGASEGLALYNGTPIFFKKQSSKVVASVTTRGRKTPLAPALFKNLLCSAMACSIDASASSKFRSLRLCRFDAADSRHGNRAAYVLVGRTPGGKVAERARPPLLPGGGPALTSMKPGSWKDVSVKACKCLGNDFRREMCSMAFA